MPHSNGGRRPYARKDPSSSDTVRRLADTPVAIVGLAGLYPKSRDLREFWTNIVTGTDCIEDVPDTHWRVEDYYDPDPTAEDKTYAKRGGFLPEVAFNPMEFGLPPNTLEVTDILQLLSLTVARDVLRDAGTQDADWYDARRTGVVLGVTGANSLTQPLSARLQTPVLKEVVRSYGLGESDAEEIAERFKKAYIPWEENSFPGMLGNVVAGRIANRFDLGGTNCTVDAACASSLAAVKLAVSELIEGRADLMLTGGCDAENTILMYMCFSKTPAFSRSQLIRPFDDSADGTLIGEGIGMLALKRLADAERDGDRVYAVLRGIGTSSDGRFKSIYAPRSEGQQVALRRAYEDAGVEAGSIGLFEAHGTGTAVGDHTELSALNAVVSEGEHAHGYAAIGSVKSQIGHTKAAAGAASLIKTALALHQKVLPPTINVENPSSAVDPESTPFYVSTEARPWISDPQRSPRRAAVSSFGFGGTNYHMVLEEHATGTAEPDPQVLGPAVRTGLWHAADPDTLAGLLADGAAPVGGGGIPSSDARVGIVARTEEEFAELRTTAAERLRAKPDADFWQHPKGIVYRRRGLPAGARVAAVFAGQGSQYVGMGRQAALTVAPVRAAFDRANELSRTAGTDATRPTPGSAALPPPAFDDAGKARQEERLRRTENAQPAIGALAAGQYRWLTGLGFAADGAIGHSFGELAALWSAGALEDDAFHALARARGDAMAPPSGAPDFDAGAMAAVRADLDAVERLIADYRDVTVCNINAPGQVVVGGPTAEIDRLVSEARAGGSVKAQRLPVSAAFHTAFVRHAADAFREAVERTGLRAPRIPVYANTRGAAYGEDVAANRRTLVDQLLQPVDFAGRIEEMYRDGFRVFVEFGPKRVLSDLVGRVLEGRADVVTVATDGGPAKDGELTLKLAALELAVLGLPLSGIDHNIAPKTELPPRKGMSIPLRGVNYVTDARRKAYRAALAEGPATEPAAPAAPAATALPTEPAAAATPQQGAAQGENEEEVTTMTREAIDLQVEILNGHLTTLRETVEALERRVRDGSLADVDAAVRLVREQGGAVTDAHERASRLLIDYLESRRDAGTDTVAEGGAPSQPAVTEIVQVRDTATEPAVPSPEQRAPEPAPAPAPTPEPEPTPEPTPTAPTTTEPDPALTTALLDVVADKTGYPADMLDTSMDLEADLGIDSIKRVQIMGALQDRFPTTTDIEPEQLGELRTINDIATFLTTLTTDTSTTSGAATAETELKTQPFRVSYPSAPGIGRTHAVVRGLPAPDALVGAWDERPGALLVDDGSALARCLAGALRGAGWRVAVLSLPDEVPGSAEADSTTALRTWETDELHHAIVAIRAGMPRLDLVVQMAAAAGQEWAGAAQRLGHALSVATETQEALQASAAGGVRAGFVAVTQLDGACGYRGSSGASPLLGGVSGLVKTLAVEAPELFCRTVDFAPGMADTAVGARFLAELTDLSPEPADVGHDAAGRRTVEPGEQPVPEPARPQAPRLTSEDLLVVTGGARGITARCLEALVAAQPTGLLLLGRTPVTEEPAYAAGLEGAALKGAIAKNLTARGSRPTPRDVEAVHREVTGSREIRANLAALRSHGAQAEYLVTDITDAASVQDALAPYAGRITGVVHGAGVLADKLIVKKSAAEAGRVLGTKLLGLGNVLAAAGDELRHVLLFSSVAGFFGNRGQSDYAMANEALNRFALQAGRLRPEARVTSLNWGAWDGGMVDDDLRAMFASRGVTLVPVETGAGMFAEQFDPARGHDSVVITGPTTPLSTAPAAAGDGVTRPVLIDRDLAGLAAEGLLADHVIGDERVLPATAALGAMAHCVEAAVAPADDPVTEIRSFRVFRGVTLGGTDGGTEAPRRLRLSLEPARESGDVDVLISAVDGTDRSRPAYGAVCHVAGRDGEPSQRPAARTDLAALARDGAGEDAAGLYADGTLFHGPSLRGIRRVLTPGTERLVLSCRLADGLPAGGTYHSRRTSPVLSDLLLQAALVWVRRFRGAASLPMEIAKARFLAPLPADEEFLVAVENVRTTASSVTCSVTACDRDGQVLQVLEDVVVIEDPQLEGKFRRATDRLGVSA